MAAPKKMPEPNAVFARMKRPNRAAEPPAEAPEAAAAVPSQETPAVQPPAPSRPEPVLAAVPDSPAHAPQTDRPDQAEPEPAKTPTLTMFFTLAVKTAFKAKARRLKMTQPVALMTAIEDVYEDLPSLFGGGRKDRKVRLFDLPASSLRDQDEGPRDASTSMKVSQANIAVIDRLAAEFGAKSRNEFLYTAVKHWVRDEPAAQD